MRRRRAGQARVAVGSGISEAAAVNCQAGIGLRAGRKEGSGDVEAPRRRPAERILRTTSCSSTIMATAIAVQS